MSKGVKIALGIVLILISIQFIYASFQYIIPALQHNLYKESIIDLFVMLIGLLLFILAIFVFLDKKWVKIPLYVILGLLLIYSAYYLISSFNLTPSIYLPQKLINWQVFLMIEYMALDIIGIILNWKNKY
ncbi:hypothetical protein HYW75_05175 [Candidatus Pacearchaeota archaeon]|nr:hypothetical protein [Candidatus Pacearchaeota archaeon]